MEQLYLIFAIISTLLACLPLALWQLYMPAGPILYRKWIFMPSAECSKESEDVYDYRNSSCACSIYLLITKNHIGIGSSDFDDDPVSNVVENVIEDKNDSKKADDSDKSDKAAKSTEPAVASGELGTS